MDRGELLELSMAPGVRDAMKSGELFLGFERIASLKPSNQVVDIRPNTPGRHTLVVEWVDLDGQLHHDAIDLQVN